MYKSASTIEVLQKMFVHGNMLLAPLSYVDTFVF